MLKGLVSILLPVYNGAERLAHALDSLFNQTYPNIEIIVCDDGSTDETLEILRSYQAQNSPLKFPLKITEHPTNLGVVAAANTCLNAAQGKFTARMDHDDVMLPKKIAKQMEFASRLDGDYLIATRIDINDMMGLRPGQWQYIHWQNASLTPVEHEREIYTECPMCHPTFLLKRELLLKVGGYQQQSWSEDYDMLFRAHIHGVKMYKMPEKLLIKSLHPDQTTWRDPSSKRGELMKAKAHYFFQDQKWMDKRKLYIMGTGSTGKLVADVLLAVGMPPIAFLDDRIEEPNRTLRGIKCLPLDQDFKPKYWNDESLILFAIADPAGKIRAREVLEKNGFDFYKEVLPWV